MPDKKSFAKSFFEDINEQKADNTKTAKPTEHTTETKWSKERQAQLRKDRDSYNRLSNELGKEADRIEGTKEDTLWGRGDAADSKTSEVLRSVSGKYRNDAIAKDRATNFRKSLIDQEYDKRVTEEKKEEDEANADKFEDNLHKYDKNRALKREFNELNTAPEMLQKPKKKTFAKKFFEDID